MQHVKSFSGLLAAAVTCAGLAGCESAARKLEQNRGALLGAAVGTGAGLAMKNNADRGENLDIYTGVGAMAGYAVGRSFDEQRSRKAEGITDEDLLRFIEQLPDDWREPSSLPPPVLEVGSPPPPAVVPELTPPVGEEPNSHRR